MNKNDGLSKRVAFSYCSVTEVLIITETFEKKEILAKDQTLSRDYYCEDTGRISKFAVKTLEESASLLILPVSSQ